MVELRVVGLPGLYGPLAGSVNDLAGPHGQTSEVFKTSELFKSSEVSETAEVFSYAYYSYSLAAT